MSEEKVSEKVEEKPEVEVLDFKALAKAREKLSKSVTEAWISTELKPVRSNLKEVGKILKKPYESAAEESGYAKLLRETAEKLKLKELMESAWGTEVKE
jgi:hypothetical protein